MGMWNKAHEYLFPRNVNESNEASEGAYKAAYFRTAPSKSLDFYYD